MIKWIGLTIYPFFVLSTWSVNGQSALNTEYEKVLNLQFEQVNAQAVSGSTDIPYFDLYLQNLSEVTQLIFSEDEAAFDSLRKNEKARLKVLKQAEEESPYIGFLRAEIKIQWAFTRLKFGEQWNGVWALRSAYKAINRNIDKYPDFDLNYKALGLLHVIFGAVPDRYHWVLNIFGLEGDTQRGLSELYRLVDKPSIFQKEVRVIVALIESYLMENHEAATQLIASNTTDLSHAERYALALVLMKSHQSGAANTLLNQSIKELGANSLATPLFKYMLAETEFQRGDYRASLQNYRFFTSHFKGANQLKDAKFKAGMSALLMGDQQTASQWFDEAIALDETDSEVDKNAQKLLEATPFPDPLLLQIRFSIDGGYYSFTDSLFNSIHVADYSPYEQFELIYRKARLYHLRENYQRAMDHYQQVIAKEEALPENYFVPNSYLQLGYLQLTLGNEDSARMYFEKVLTFRKHPYKNSLDSKAKIALKGLLKSDE